MGRCDNFQEVRKSSGVKGIRKVCQLMERCEGSVGDVRVCRKV